MTVTAAEFTRLVRASHAAAQQHEPSLAAAYQRGIHRCVVIAKQNFARHTKPAAAHALVAAATPEWALPDEDEVLSMLVASLEVEKATRRPRAKLVEAVIRDTAVALSLDFATTNRLIEGVLEQLGSKITEIADTTRGEIMRSLQHSYDEGLSIPHASRDMMRAVDALSVARSTMIARTELIGAVNGGSLELARVTGAAQTKTWLATDDDRVRPDHDEADGQTVPVDAPFIVGGAEMMYPGDPDGPADEVVNCFPASARVQLPGLRAVERRWYSGDLVRVHFASGDELAATPNHPVLRSDGWAALHEVEEGDYLVRGSLLREDVAAPDVDDVPTEFGEIYEAAMVEAVAERVAGSPPDFHGDGAYGEVEVVAVDGCLLLDGEAASDEDVEHLGLAFADVARAGLGGGGRPVLCPGGARFDFDHAASGLVSGERPGAALLDRPTGCEDSVRICPAPRRDASFAQSTNDSRPTARVCSGETRDALTVEVSADEVVAVEIEAFQGYVFNADTGHGWYIADGIISRNCRCTLTYGEANDDGGDAGMTASAKANRPMRLTHEDGRTAEVPATVEMRGAVRFVTVDASVNGGEPGEPTRWHALLAPIGAATDDGRILDPAEDGAISWRELPLTMMAQFETAGGHDGAVVAGRIDQIGVASEDGILGFYADGVFDDATDGSEAGGEAARLTRDGTLRGISIDLAVEEVELRTRDNEVIDENDEEAFWDALMGDGLMAVTRGKIMGATMTPFPAFADARVVVVASIDHAFAIVAAANAARSVAAAATLEARLGVDEQAASPAAAPIIATLPRRDAPAGPPTVSVQPMLVPAAPISVSHDEALALGALAAGGFVSRNEVRDRLNLERVSGLDSLAVRADELQLAQLVAAETAQRRDGDVAGSLRAVAEGLAASGRTGLAIEQALADVRGAHSILASAVERVESAATRPPRKLRVLRDEQGQATGYEEVQNEIKDEV